VLTRSIESKGSRMKGRSRGRCIVFEEIKGVFDDPFASMGTQSRMVDDCKGWLLELTIDARGDWALMWPASLLDRWSEGETMGGVYWMRLGVVIVAIIGIKECGI
jgi:hypothetical protein